MFVYVFVAAIVVIVLEVRIHHTINFEEPGGVPHGRKYKEIWLANLPLTSTVSHNHVGAGVSERKTTGNTLSHTSTVTPLDPGHLHSVSA